MRQRRLALLLTICLFLAACFGGDTVIQSLRATIAASAPFRETLVAEKVISPELSTKLGTDFDDAADCADTLNQDFKAIPKDAVDKDNQKRNAAIKAGRCWKPILLRQNFAQHPRLVRVANIIDGAFAAVIVFYSSDGPIVASAEGASTPRNEKELEADLKKRIKELREAMKS